MSVTTMSFRHANGFDALMSAVAQALARAARPVAQLARRKPAPSLSAQRREPRNADDLLAWAEQYEASQPSYAADLRAAALHHLGREG